MSPERPLFDGISPELLDRYLAGEGTEDENALVRRFLMARPDVAEEVRQLLLALDGEAGRPDVPDARVSLAALRSRISQSSGTPPGSSTPRRSPVFTRLPSTRKGPPRWLTMARFAGALAAVAAAIVLIRMPARRGEPTPPPVEWRTYATNNGESADLRLVDGTRIRLAPASRLRVPSDYGDVRRQLDLEGEGFFDVVHDVRRPFLVRAGNTIAEDLGTQFSVRSYAEDRHVQVVVRDGAVDLAGVGRLERGDVGRLTREGESMIRHRVNVDSMLAWLGGRLDFDGAPLAEVALAFRRWHDVEVEFTDSALTTIPFTGSLTNASVDAAVNLVAATVGLRAQRSGRRVMLSPIRGITPTYRTR